MSFQVLSLKEEECKGVVSRRSSLDESYKQATIKEQKIEEVALTGIGKVSALKRPSDSALTFEQSQAKKLTIQLDKDKLFSLIYGALLLRMESIKNLENQYQYIPDNIQNLFKSDNKRGLLDYCRSVFFDCDVISPDMLDVLLFLFKFPRATCSEMLLFDYYSKLKMIIECVIKQGFNTIFHSIIDSGILLDDIKVESLSLILSAYRNKQYVIAAAILENNKHRAAELLDELVYDCNVLICIFPFLNLSFVDLILASLVRKSFISLEVDSAGVYYVNSRCSKIEDFCNTTFPTPLEQALTFDDFSLFLLILELGALNISSIKGCSVVHYALFMNDGKAISRAFKYISVKDLSIQGFNLISFLINQRAWVSLFTLHIFGYKIEDHIKKLYLSLVDKEQCLDILVELSVNLEIMKDAFKCNVVDILKRREFQDSDIKDRVAVLLPSFEIDVYDNLDEFDLPEECELIDIRNDCIVVSENFENQETQRVFLLDLINQAFNDFDNEHQNKQCLEYFNIKIMLPQIRVCVENFDVEGCLDLYSIFLQGKNIIRDQINKLFEQILGYLILQIDKDCIEKLEFVFKKAFYECELQAVTFLAQIYKAKFNRRTRIHLREFLTIINHIQIAYGIKVSFINDALNIGEIEYFVEDPVDCIDLLDRYGFLTETKTSLIAEFIKSRNLNFLKIFLQKSGVINNFDKSIYFAFLLALHVRDYQNGAFILEHSQVGCNLLSALDSMVNKYTILTSMLEHSDKESFRNQIILYLVRIGSIDLEINDHGECDINDRCNKVPDLDPRYFTPLEQALLIDNEDLFHLLIALKASKESSIINYNVLHFALVFGNKKVLLSVLKKMPNLILDLRSNGIVWLLFISQFWLFILVLYLFGFEIETNFLKLAISSIDRSELSDFLFRLSNNQKLMNDDLKTKVLKLLENKRFKVDVKEYNLELIISLYTNLKCSTSNLVLPKCRPVSFFGGVEFGLSCKFGFYDEISFNNCYGLDRIFVIKQNCSSIIRTITEQNNPAQEDVLIALLELQDIFNNKINYSEAIDLVEAFLLNNKDLSLDVIGLMYDILDVTIINNSKNQFLRVQALVLKLIEEGKIVESTKLSKLWFNKTNSPVKVLKNNLIQFLNNKEILLKDKMLFLEALVYFINIDSTTIFVDQKGLLDCISDTNRHPELLEETLVVFLLSQENFLLAKYLSNSFSTEQLHTCFSLYLETVSPFRSVLNKCLEVFINTKLKVLIFDNAQNFEQLEDVLESLSNVLVYYMKEDISENDSEEKSLDLEIIEPSEEVLVDSIQEDISENDSEEKSLDLEIIEPSEEVLVDSIQEDISENDSEENSLDLEIIEPSEEVLVDSIQEDKAETSQASIDFDKIQDKNAKNFFGVLEEALINNNEILLKQLLEFNDSKSPIICFNMFRAAFSTDDIDIIFLCFHYFSLHNVLDYKIDDFVDFCIKEKKWHSIFIMRLVGFAIPNYFYRESKVRLGIDTILHVFVLIAQEKLLFIKNVKKFVLSCLLKEQLLTENIEDMSSRACYLLSLYCIDEIRVICDSYGESIEQIELGINIINEIAEQRNAFINYLYCDNFERCLEILDQLDVYKQEALFNSLGLLDRDRIVIFLDWLFTTTKGSFSRYLILRLLFMCDFLKTLHEASDTDCEFVISEYLVTNLAYEFMEKTDFLFSLLVKLLDKKQLEELFVNFIKHRKFIQASKLFKNPCFKYKEPLLHLLDKLDKKDIFEFLVVLLKTKNKMFLYNLIVGYMTSLGLIKIVQENQNSDTNDIKCTCNVVVITSTQFFKDQRELLMEVLYLLKIKQLTPLVEDKNADGLIHIEEKRLNDFVKTVNKRAFRIAVKMFNDFDLEKKQKAFVLLKLIARKSAFNFSLELLRSATSILCNNLILNFLSDLGFIKFVSILKEVELQTTFVVDYTVTELAYEFMKDTGCLLELLIKLQNNKQKQDFFVGLVKRRLFKKAVRLCLFFLTIETESFLELLHDVKDNDFIDFLMLQIKLKKNCLSKNTVLKQMLSRGFIKRPLIYSEIQVDDILCDKIFVISSNTEMFKTRKQSLIEVLHYFKINTMDSLKNQAVTIMGQKSVLKLHSKEEIKEIIENCDFKTALEKIEDLDAYRKEICFKYLGSVEDAIIIDFLNYILNSTKKNTFKGLILHCLEVKGFIRTDRGYDVEGSETRMQVLNFFVTELAYDVIKTEELLFDILIKLQSYEQQKIAVVFFITIKDFQKACKILDHSSDRLRESVLNMFYDLEEMVVIEFLDLALKTKNNYFSREVVLRYLFYRKIIIVKPKKASPDNFLGIKFENDLILLSSTNAFKKQKESLINILSYLNITPI